MFSYGNNFKASTVTLQYQSHLYNSLMCNVVITNTHKLVSSLLLFEGEKYQMSLLNQYAKGISLKIYNVQDLVEISQFIYDLQDFPRCQNLEGAFEITEKFLRVKRGDPKQFLLFAGFGFKGQRRKMRESECYEERKLRQMLGAIHYNQIGKKYYAQIVDKAVKLYIGQRQNAKILHQEVLRSRSKRLSNREKQSSNPQSRRNLNTEGFLSSRKKLSEKKLKKDHSPQESQASMNRMTERVSRFNGRRQSILVQDSECQRINGENKNLSSLKSKEQQIINKKFSKKRTTIEWKLGQGSSKKEEQNNMKILKPRKTNLRWAQTQNESFVCQKQRILKQAQQNPQKKYSPICRNKITKLLLSKESRTNKIKKFEELSDSKVQQENSLGQNRLQNLNEKEQLFKGKAKRKNVYCLNMKESLTLKLKSNEDQKLYYTKFEDHIMNYIKKLESDNKSVQYNSCRQKKLDNLQRIFSEVTTNISTIPFTLTQRIQKQKQPKHRLPRNQRNSYLSRA